MHSDNKRPATLLSCDWKEYCFILWFFLISQFKISTFITRQLSKEASPLPYQHILFWAKQRGNKCRITEITIWGLWCAFNAVHWSSSDIIKTIIKSCTLTSWMKDVTCLSEQWIFGCVKNRRIYLSSGYQREVSTLHILMTLWTLSPWALNYVATLLQIWSICLDFHARLTAPFRGLISSRLS